MHIQNINLDMPKLQNIMEDMLRLQLRVTLHMDIRLGDILLRPTHLRPMDMLEPIQDTPRIRDILRPQPAAQKPPLRMA